MNTIPQSTATQLALAYPFVGYVCSPWQPHLFLRMPAPTPDHLWSEQQTPSGSVAALSDHLERVQAAKAVASNAGDQQVMGRVWILSREPEGCRHVQSALECGNSDEARAAIAAELRGHVWEAIRCPHANHVIQKCIIMLRPRAAQFIVDEIMKGPIVFQAVRHKYGCRTVQRLLEQCLPDQLHGLAEAILSDVYWLSRHPYGNYVIQHLLEFGTTSQQSRIAEAVTANLCGLARDTHGRSVVNACLFHGPAERKTALAGAIQEEAGLLEVMGGTRHGRLAARAVREVLRGPEAVAERGQRLRRAQRRPGRASTAPSPL
mmetsp:Transcript_12668/g.39936  ORF Transcript_12668/g.39936 Transcript_12668/m.39936 type:complete len:319 (+) Transcript_12668:43-999(+)